MLKKARDWIGEVLERGETGAKEECEYYPCHFEGQDCAWCFCPFYPCLDERTGGKYGRGKRSGKMVWSCEDCTWIHDPGVAKRILEKLMALDEDVGKLGIKALRKLREDILEERHD